MQSAAKPAVKKSRRGDSKKTAVAAAKRAVAQFELKHKHIQKQMEQRDEFPCFYAINTQQQSFLLNYLGGDTSMRFNRVAAYKAAGYKGTADPYNCATKVLRHDGVQAAMGELMHAGIIHAGLTPEYVKELVGQALRGVDVADLEPFLKGKKSLAELRDDGVNTGAIMSVERNVRQNKDQSDERVKVGLLNPAQILRLGADVAGVTTRHVQVNHKHVIDVKGLCPEDLARLNHALRPLVEIEEAEYAIREDNDGDSGGVCPTGSGGDGEALALPAGGGSDDSDAEDPMGDGEA